MKQRLNAVSSQVCSSQLFSSFMCNIVVDISCKWFNTLTCLVSYDKTWYRLHSYIFTVELCLLNKCLVSHIIAVELLLKGPTKSHLLKLENACKQSVPLQCKHFQATCISTDRIGAKNELLSPSTRCIPPCPVPPACLHHLGVSSYFVHPADPNNIIEEWAHERRHLIWLRAVARSTF